ncbi:hypothetical protein [Paraglaciecola polaris]|uniref:Uncharacterized protein n=1 Tax=Paraglaciecola polaris LMG 21857 TaxID=1129793 RepID=K6ZVP0_9ALTE|nr:hypothetical protein [Paraglaciecola polaris]GAC32853.1 hypothetical protein GPLA_1946 [Paraglaciecola polaris LMG 21857]
MKTFHDRYNLHTDIESIENYIDGTFRKINRTSRSLHKPAPSSRKASWHERENESTPHH